MDQTGTEMNHSGRERQGKRGRVFEMLMEAWAVNGEGGRGGEGYQKCLPGHD